MSFPWFRQILTAVYPASCPACDAPVHATGMCSLCLESCESIDVGCPTCAKPISGSRAVLCGRCIRNPPPVTSCTSVFQFGGQLAVALKRLKFSGRNDIARALSTHLAPHFADVARHVDVAIPIPLHKRRLRQRGFNQAQRLLIPLAATHDLLVARNVLSRIRYTEAQARLGANRRRTNMNSAFRSSSKIRGKRVLLLDDIRTTGETLHAASRALRQAGAEQVHCFVVARAEWNTS